MVATKIRIEDKYGQFFAEYRFFIFPYFNHIIP